MKDAFVVADGGCVLSSGGNSLLEYGVSLFWIFSAVSPGASAKQLTNKWLQTFLGR